MTSPGASSDPVTLIGTDREGRPITFDATTGRFSVGGMGTDIERLVVYARADQVAWASPEVEAWTRDFLRWSSERTSAARGAEAAAAAARSKRRRWIGSIVLCVVLLPAAVSVGAWVSWVDSPRHAVLMYVNAENANDWEELQKHMDLEAVASRQVDKEIGQMLGASNGGAQSPVLAAGLASELKPALVQRVISDKQREVQAQPKHSLVNPLRYAILGPFPKREEMIGDQFVVTMSLAAPPTGAVRDMTFTLARTSSGWRIVGVDDPLVDNVPPH